MPSAIQSCPILSCRDRNLAKNGRLRALIERHFRGSKPLQIFTKLRPIIVYICPSPTEAGGTTVYPGASRSSRFMDRGEPGENDVFLPKNLDGRPSRPSKTREHPGAPRFIQVEPRQGHGSSRRLHGSPRFSYRFSGRFSGRFSTVHPGPCRQNPGDATVLPGSPRRSYGPSRFVAAR